MKTKTKILVTGRSMSVGGVEKALLSLINTLDIDKYDIDLLLAVPEGEYIDQINSNIHRLQTPKDFSWILLPKGKVFSCMFKLLMRPIILYYFISCILHGITHKNMAKARQQMWKHCCRFLPTINKQYDVALDFSGLLRKYVLDNVSAQKKYTWIHSDYRKFGLDKLLDEKLLVLYDAIFCVSKTCKSIFDEEFPELFRKSKVLHNTIDRDLIMRQISNGGFSDDYKGIRLLDVTRIDPNKGLDIAVRVCRRLIERGLDFKWYILGNDPLGYKDTLKKIIYENKVEDHFILLGFTGNPYPYIHQTDIVVHFSRFEGRSVSIDEALVLCKPILLTDYPTAKDQINSGVNGLICSFEEDALVETLSHLISDKQEREKFSKYLELIVFQNEALPF